MHGEHPGHGTDRSGRNVRRPDGCRGTADDRLAARRRAHLGRRADRVPGRHRHVHGRQQHHLEPIRPSRGVGPIHREPRVPRRDQGLQPRKGDRRPADRSPQRRRPTRPPGRRRSHGAVDHPAPGHPVPRVGCDDHHQGPSPHRRPHRPNPRRRPRRRRGGPRRTWPPRSARPPGDARTNQPDRRLRPTPSP